jgi:hypothetical protein
MRHVVRSLIVAAFALAVAYSPGAALAQGTVKQIKLTDKQIEGFVSAQKDMTAIADKIQGSAAEKPDPKIQAELEGIAKKHGFVNFAEYDDVAANISMVMAGIDPQTKKFTEPHVAIQKEIDEVTADTSIPEKEKKQMLEEYNEALKTAQPIQHPGNVDLVTKYWDKIDAVLQ